MLKMSQYVENELCKFGFTAERIVELTGERFDITKAPVFLAGSIVDELSNDESDVDVLVINKQEIEGHRSMIDGGLIVDTIGLEGGRLQIAQCSEDRLSNLITVIDALLDPDNGQLKILNVQEKRIIHRICTGVSLHNHNAAEKYRASIGKKKFSRYCMITSTYEVESALKDALGEFKSERWLSACTMLQRASVLMGMAKLYEFGETNQNPKWVTRLLLHNVAGIGPSVVDSLINGILPSTDLIKTPIKISKLYEDIKSMYDTIVSNNKNMFAHKGSETE